MNFENYGHYLSASLSAMTEPSQAELDEYDRQRTEEKRLFDEQVQMLARFDAAGIKGEFVDVLRHCCDHGCGNACARCCPWPDDKAIKFADEQEAAENRALQMLDSLVVGARCEFMRSLWMTDDRKYRVNVGVVERLTAKRVVYRNEHGNVQMFTRDGRDVSGAEPRDRGHLRLLIDDNPAPSFKDDDK